MITSAKADNDQRKCDAVINYRPCSKRATTKLIPDHVSGQNFVLTYWCNSHAEGGLRLVLMVEEMPTVEELRKARWAARK